MGYNPCGAICDYIDAPYTTAFRPFSDSELEAQIVWYPAREDAPVLPFPSVVQSRTNFPDQSWEVTGVGEVYDAPRTRNHERRKLGARGLHVCGTAADFAGRALYNPDAPPVAYDAEGLPVCCGAAQPLQGGSETGGEFTASYEPPAVTPLPGLTCSDAGVVNLADEHVWHSAVTTNCTWRVNGSPAGVYHLTWSVLFAAPNVLLFSGPNCGAMTLDDSSTVPGCLQTSGGVADVLLVSVALPAGATFTFQFDAGPC